MSGYLWLWLGLSVGNAIYQFFRKEPDWEKAFEISYFQGAALMIAALVVK